MVKSIENNTYQYRSNKLIGQGPQVTSKYIAYPPAKVIATFGWLALAEFPV